MLDTSFHIRLSDALAMEKIEEFFEKDFIQLLDDTDIVRICAKLFYESMENLHTLTEWPGRNGESFHGKYLIVDGLRLTLIVLLKGTQVQPILVDWQKGFVRNVRYANAIIAELWGVNDDLVLAKQWGLKNLFLK